MTTPTKAKNSEIGIPTSEIKIYLCRIMSKSTDELFKNVISHAKEYGFVFPSSEIYDGLSAVYDYGQFGSELKNNIKTYWWKAMVQMNENIVGIDSAIFMHPKIWKASGHVDGFSDPMIDNRVTKKRYRADQLIEDKIATYLSVTGEFNENAKNSFDNFFENMLSWRIESQKEWIKKDYPALGENYPFIDEANWKTAVDGLKLQMQLNIALIEENLAELKRLIIDNNILDPNSKDRPDWTDVRQFNLMFSTQMGAVADDSDVVYLRPETAQGIFVNYLNVQ